MPLYGPPGHVVRDEGANLAQAPYVDFVGAGVSVATAAGVTTATIAGAGSTDGWTAAGETWTYTSVDAPTGVFGVNADVTAKYSVGMRVKFTQTTVKYGIITAVGAFSAGSTPITICTGTDYTLANAAITLPFWSMVKAPFGFPQNPTKWTVELNDTSAITQATPTANTWYNPGSLSISIPIGCWNVSYQVSAYFSDATAAGYTQNVTLSTANNSQSDADWTAAIYNNVIRELLVTLTRQKIIAVTVKTSYFLNAMTPNTGLDSINIQGSSAPTIIRAVCAYL